MLGIVAMDTGDDVDIVVAGELNRKGADIAGAALDNDAPRFARRSGSNSVRHAGVYTGRGRPTAPS
jgi:hypothetical protein